MGRLDRIRKQIVTKAIATDGWFDENPSEDDDTVSNMLEDGKMGRHLWLQTGTRRQQTIEHLFTLTNKDKTL